MTAYEFLMATLEAMKTAEVAEWQVRELAIEQYGKLLTKDDLETIDGWYEENDG